MDQRRRKENYEYEIATKKIFSIVVFVLSVWSILMFTNEINDYNNTHKGTCEMLGLNYIEKKYNTWVSENTLFNFTSNKMNTIIKDVYKCMLPESIIPNVEKCPQNHDTIKCYATMTTKKRIQLEEPVTKLEYIFSIIMLIFLPFGLIWSLLIGYSGFTAPEFNVDNSI